MHSFAQKASLLQCDYFLYDQKLLPGVDHSFFVQDFWQKQGCLLEKAQGRGNTYAFAYDQKSFFLRHYRRGGSVAPIMRDTYLWTGLRSTRAWREFLLLRAMRAEGLPVPRPGAAHVQRIGPLYRADLVTERIEQAAPLSLIIAGQHMDKDLWIKIGCCVQRFHCQGIVHADLNAHNILIDDRESVWLIDFDKGIWGQPKAAWLTANLNRLYRSLCKVWPPEYEAYTLPRAWDAFLQGYRSA